MRRLAALMLLAASPLPVLAAEAPLPGKPAAEAPAASASGLPAADAVGRIASGLAAHRALYKLTLDHARGDVVGANGVMAYEVTDACDGWAARQRLQMNISNRDGQTVRMVSDYTTYESKDGTKLTFRMRQTTEDAVTQQVEGTASLDHPFGTGTVHYTVPKDQTMPLPDGVAFPMWHTATIVAAAERGTKFIALPLFDGTGPDGAQDSSVAITGWGKSGGPYPALKDQPSGRVHVAFFPRGKDATQPEYEVAMRYWQDGVADDLLMDFGDFAMAGKLGEFEPRPGHC